MLSLCVSIQVHGKIHNIPSLIRITPHFYLQTPLGPAEAHFLWTADDLELAAQWCCFQIETKENWWWSNQHIRLMSSVSAGRDNNMTDFALSSELLETLRPHVARHKQSPLFVE